MVIARSGGGANVSASAATSSDFFTNFPTIENPLSQGGIWLNGQADGVDWHNDQVTANGCVGSQDSFVTRYADDIACLKTSYRTFNAAQFAKATIYKAGGYTGNGGSHELELLLRWSITSSNARGYECSIGMSPSPAVYVFIVRWEGAAGSYTTLIDPGHGLGSYINAPTGPADGDVFYAEITSGGVMTVKQNNTSILTYTDSTWATGQPGCGFWPVDGAVCTSAGWKDFRAGDL